MALANHCTETQQKTQKHYVVLNDGSYCPVPEGADADDVRKLQNRILASRQAGTAKRTRKSSGSGKPSRRANYAEQVVHRAIFFNDEVMVI